MATGTVVWFFEEKGYSFIEFDEGARRSSCTTPA
jgi:cold shock CspA family protein